MSPTTSDTATGTVRPAESAAISLADAAGRHRELGAKAANLGTALRAGFPVPDGAVITAASLHYAFAGWKPSGTDLAVPPSLEQSLRDVLDRLGPGPLAVRSSALAEDLANASYAGQYETILGVEGLPALGEAVHRCWESAFAERVATYERASDAGPSVEGPRGMAVLIQRLVAADAAGVAFTANPVSGARDETLVSAVRGLGHRLVSGEAMPDEWTVCGERIERRGGAEHAIDAQQARAIAKLARRVEAHFGAPQDIEWALEGGSLFLLQARPITALPDVTERSLLVAAEPTTTPAMPVNVPVGFWEREASHFPWPLFPMTHSLMIAREIDALARALEQFGMLADGLDFREIGGWMYTRVVPLGGKDRPVTPAPVMWLLARVHPQLRRRVAAARRAVREDLAGQVIRRWHNEIRPQLQATIRELRDAELGAIDDDRLRAHWERVDALLTDGFAAHFTLHVPVALARRELGVSCHELLGWSEPRAFELLGGLSTMSTEPARRLAQLAEMAAERPGLHALIERADRDAASMLSVENTEFAHAFGEYQRQYGVRALRYEAAEATLAEMPELMLATLRDQLRSGYDPSADARALATRRARAIAEARAALARRPEADRSRFERALQRAEAAHPVHEENEFYTMSAPFALARYALLEIGQRLAARAVISERDDVFFLEIDEALTALADGGGHRAVVACRKGERAWALAHPGPASYGRDPGPPPPLRALPPEARQMMDAMLWAVDRIFAQRSAQRQAPGSALITGIAASPGRYAGTVRVLAGEHEFGKIQAGDILVCPVTSPVWSVLFSRIGALVTDSGGILSHPAIIAREYGIPAVVATGNATALLRDGQRVLVDGDEGLVETDPARVA